MAPVICLRCRKGRTRIKCGCHPCTKGATACACSGVWHASREHPEVYCPECAQAGCTAKTCRCRASLEVTPPRPAPAPHPAAG